MNLRIIGIGKQDINVSHKGTLIINRNDKFLECFKRLNYMGRNLKHTENSGVFISKRYQSPVYLDRKRSSVLLY